MGVSSWTLAFKSSHTILSNVLSFGVNTIINIDQKLCFMFEIHTYLKVILHSDTFTIYTVDMYKKRVFSKCVMCSILFDFKDVTYENSVS